MTIELTAQHQLLVEMALAMFLGGLIGLERELADKPAGLRTHMLLAATATLLVGLSDILIMASQASGRSGGDPVRVVQAIVMGIGFLGAGTIIRQRDAEHIEGLTTGASLLFVSALGIAVAAEQWVLAAGATAIALLVLRILSPLEHWLMRKRKKRQERAGDKPAGL